MSILDTVRGWFGRKRAPPLSTATFTIGISPPARSEPVDLRPYTEKEIRVFCKAACPPGFEVVEYPKPGDEPRVLLHFRGEPTTHKHKMFIVRSKPTVRK